MLCMRESIYIQMNMVVRKHDYLWNEYIYVFTCMLICVLTLTEVLLTISSMIPNSAAWEETFSLLIEPTQGLWIPNCGATLLDAWLGICQNISSGTLSGNTKLDKKMQETDLFNQKIKNKRRIFTISYWCTSKKKTKTSALSITTICLSRINLLSFSLSI